MYLARKFRTTTFACANGKVESRLSEVHSFTSQRLTPELITPISLHLVFPHTD